MDYQISIGKLKRNLPLVKIGENTQIASFVLLGDTELTIEAARQLKDQLTLDFDFVVTLESKGIPLAHELTRKTNRDHYVVIRKSIKSYMTEPVVTTVESITTSEPQQLVLDGMDAATLSGKRVVLLDDVISTGGSLKAAEELLARVSCQVVAKVAILAEGAAAHRNDIIYLSSLPLFDARGQIKD
ncbi:adenine phosphoribosyltransferase [Limosilactobacillus gastricus]|uniref:Adenine phosphoribosyltransferase n=1 Tax=Limosilactobacillus gastricus DSM 16045 TaxID=1423749 RepID=A0A0R1VD02_9LACO|nr:phosphoribosyltransferase family protein [Limosilactobacillus gastricus]KRM03408.1 Adenine phosphoribosyltransferase [Limosilactobacillus gastricus DSM 16045]QGF40881.1 adenine phosphoribosyltransferase [Limosilactobacillus gastricus]